MAEEHRPLMSDNDHDGPSGVRQSVKPLRKSALPLNIVIIILSIISWAFFIAIKILRSESPRYWYPWRYEMRYDTLLGLTITGFIFSTLNIIRIRTVKLPLPLLINFAASLILGVWALVNNIHGVLHAVNHQIGHCSRPWQRPGIGQPPKPINLSKCFAFEEKIEIVYGVGMGIGILFAVFELVLLSFHIIDAYKSRFWQNQSFLGLRLPAGRLSVEFSIQFHRQERDQGLPSSEPQREGQIRL